MKSEKLPKTPIPYVVGASPNFDINQPSITDLPFVDAIKRFDAEGAVIGEVDLPTGLKFIAICNGLPYVDGANEGHFMTASSSAEMPNVTSYEPCDLAAMLGISRNFLRQNPDPEKFMRMFGFNSGPANCQEDEQGTKGFHAQTWSNLHIHNIQSGVRDMQPEFDSFGNQERMEYLRKARLKGAEPFAQLIEDLAKGVVSDAIAGANLAGKAAIVASGERIIRGAVSVDITRISDLNLALLLQAQHRRYVTTHEEAMSIFVSDYQVGAGNIWSMNSQDERMRRAEAYMIKLANSGIYNEDELSGMRRNLGRAATMARSRQELGVDRNSSAKSKMRAAWEGPTYAVAVLANGPTQTLIFRPAPFTNAGVMEAVGYAPQRQKNVVIPIAVYDANHKAAAEAFAMAVRGM